MNELVTSLAQYISSNPLVAFGAVALGGIVTSANPCVLVTLPLIIGFTGGYAQPGIRKALTFSLMFVLGLSFTFTILGVIAALAGRLLGDIGGWWQYLVAAIVILMGLQLVGLFEIPLPARHTTPSKTRGPLGAFLLGMVSGLISSPCATPVLAVILTYVATEGNVVYGGSLLFVYAVGHSILLLIAGTSAGAARWLIESKQVASGSLWMRRIMGILLLTGGVWLLGSALRVV